MALDRALIPDATTAGAAAHERMTRLFPICRSITGDGLRETLRLIGHEVQLETVETPTGTQVLDWTVPDEWNIRGAWIEAPDGRRVVDFADSNLHVLNYSVPIDAVVPLEELRDHVFTHPLNPDLVPYRTSYYVERWGFCMSQRQLDALGPGNYHVVVDSTIGPGSTTYGEALVAGSTPDEVVLTTYACHPSLANDNLSGIAVLAELAGTLAARAGLRYTYRFICRLRARSAPSLARAESRDGGPGHARPRPVLPRRPRALHIQAEPARRRRDRQGGGERPRAAPGSRVNDWFPYGGDERQFCSPGFDLPFGAFSRTPADQFPEYHSSADDLDFVRPEHLGESFAALIDVIDVVESDGIFLNRSPYGEPQLGPRGLYRGVGGGSSEELALLWVLSLSDGTNSLLDISDRSGLAFPEIRSAAERLQAHDLVGRTA